MHVQGLCCESFWLVSYLFGLGFLAFQTQQNRNHPVHVPFCLELSIYLNLEIRSYSGAFILWCEVSRVLMLLNTLGNILPLQSTSQRLAN